MEEYEPGSIRTYLMQMGDIPLLSRRQELATARRIERTRRNLRLAILESDYILQASLCIFDEVLTGSMRIEQAVGISLSDPRMAGGLLHGLRPTGGLWRSFWSGTSRTFTWPWTAAGPMRAVARPTGGCAAAAAGLPA